MAFTGGAAVTAGSVYYAALSVGTFGGAGGTISLYNFVNAGMGDLFGGGTVTPPTSEVMIKGSSHPLAGTVSTFTGAGTGLVLAVRE